jgi:hypothetical protein
MVVRELDARYPRARTERETAGKKSEILAAGRKLKFILNKQREREVLGD